MIDHDDLIALVGVIAPADRISTAIGAYNSTFPIGAEGICGLLTIGPGNFVAVLFISSHISAGPELHL